MLNNYIAVKCTVVSWTVHGIPNTMVVPIGSSTATSIALPLPSDFHFHRTANLTPLVFMRMRRLCSIRHMSVGVLSILCSMQCISPMRGYDQINMVVVLLLALCTPVNALYPHSCGQETKLFEYYLSKDSSMG